MQGHYLVARLHRGIKGVHCHDLAGRKPIPSFMRGLLARFGLHNRSGCERFNQDANRPVSPINPLALHSSGVSSSTVVIARKSVGDPMSRSAGTGSIRVRSATEISHPQRQDCATVVGAKPTAALVYASIIVAILNNADTTVEAAKERQCMEYSVEVCNAMRACSSS